MILFLGRHLIGVLECHQLTPPNKIIFFSKSKLCTPATKLPPLLLSTLYDKFDNEKELCNMTDIDFVQLSQLFQLGVKFLHGGMLPIFNALVYLSFHHNNL
jgi:hypothetical protein